MKTLPLLLLVIASTVHASTIPIDLGPLTIYPANSEVRIPFNSGITSLSGQTLSLDLTFANNGSIRLLADSNHSFEIAASLVVFGSGTLSSSSGTAYTLDQNGQCNSFIEPFAFGPVQAENETFDFELGFSFPLFTDVNGTLRTDIAYPFNIYGFHLETTLPSSSDFTILGSNLFLGSGGSNPFFIGPTIPENVNSFCILAFSFVMLAFLHKKHCT